MDTQSQINLIMSLKNEIKPIQAPIIQNIKPIEENKEVIMEKDDAQNQTNIREDVKEKSQILEVQSDKMEVEDLLEPVQTVPEPK